MNARKFVLTAALCSIILHGYMTHYAPGSMRAAYLNQLRYRHVTPCPECVGQIALVDCEYLDERVHLRVRGVTYGPLHVVDCAEAQYHAALDGRGIIGELDYVMATRLGTLRQVLRDAYIIIPEERTPRGFVE